MKYGNFVTTEYLTFTPSELKAIKNHLNNQLTNTFGEGFFKKPVVKKGIGKFHIIEFPLVEPFTGRNKYRSRVYNVRAVCFLASKDKGKLEIDWEKGIYDYENAPEQDYSLSMFVEGREQPYKCSRIESIQTFKPYVYGSEITDLTYDREDLQNLKKAITQF